VVRGATVRGIDVARPWREPALGQILRALGNQGVLRLPDQHLDLGALKGHIPVSCGSCGTVESVLGTVMFETVKFPGQAGQSCNGSRTSRTFGQPDDSH
jgi:hypothetical protein